MQGEDTIVHQRDSLCFPSLPPSCFYYSQTADGVLSKAGETWLGKLKVVVNFWWVSHEACHRGGAFYHYKMEAFRLTLHLHTMQQVCVCVSVCILSFFPFYGM